MWHPLDVVVFGPAAAPNPSAWTDLDLSAHVGTQIVLVVIEIDGASYRFRTNGDADPYANQGISCTNTSSSAGRYAMTLTDSNGICEWYCTTAGSTTKIKLLGYADITSANDLVFNGSPIYNADYNVFEDVDASAIVGAAKRLCIIKSKCITYPETNNLAFRPYDGDPDGYCDYAGLQYYGTSVAWGGCNAQGEFVENYAVLMAIATGSTGKYQQRKRRNYGLTFEETILGWTSDWHEPASWLQVVQAYGSPAAGWITLDLSPWIGAQDALAFLQVRTKGTGGATYPMARIRPKGNIAGDGSVRPYGCATGQGYGSTTRYAGGILAIPTDSSGRIEIQFFNMTLANMFVDVKLYGWIPNKEMSAFRLPPADVHAAEFTLDASQAAGTYDLCAALGDVLIHQMSFYSVDNGTVFTSVSLQSDQTNPTVVLTPAEGALANVAAQKNLAKAYGRWPIQLRHGQKLQYEIVGAAGTGSIKAVVLYTPMYNGLDGSMV